MLLVTLRQGEWLDIQTPAGPVRVFYLGPNLGGSGEKLGFKADRKIPINRSEVLERGHLAGGLNGTAQRRPT